ETFVKGGDETGSSGFGVDGDHVDLNINVTTLQPIGPAEVVADIVVTSSSSPSGNAGLGTPHHTTGGTFTITIAGLGTTAPLAWDAPASAVRAALEALDGSTLQQDPEDNDFGV